MTDKTLKTLFEHFRSIAAYATGSSGSVGQASDNRVGIAGPDTTIPVVGSPPPPPAISTNSSSGSSALSLASEVFGSGLGLLPLVTGLMGLFDGGPSGPPPLTKYVMPQRLNFSGADTGSGISEASYDQMGIPRIAGAATDSSIGLPGPPSTNRGGSSSASNAQINVTVQAMDAQSFMDRSNDIAQAVRQAMLNSSSINDVMSEM